MPCQAIQEERIQQEISETGIPNDHFNQASNFILPSFTTHRETNLRSFDDLANLPSVLHDFL